LRRRQPGEGSPPSKRPPAALDGDLGLRKARFYAGCLRADRALDAIPAAPSEAPPAPAAAPSLSGEEEARGEASPMEAAMTDQISLARSTKQAPGSSVPTLKASMSGYMSTCRLAKIHPSSTGIIRPSEDKLKLEYGYVTDARIEAMVQTLRAASGDIREVSLRSNGLTMKGAKALLEALPISVELIDLSQNDLGQGDVWCEGLRRLTALRSFTVSDCQMGDTACRALCRALSRCTSLTTLDLSGNNITHAGGAVGQLVRYLKGLSSLDLHWNHITGESAKDLLRGLLENSQAGGVLSNVDVAWNPLGKMNSDESAAQLAQIFRETKSLRHLDLSKCDLSAASCAVLADGLRDNKTILGIHVLGDEACMTPDGFMLPMPMVPQTEPLASGTAASGMGESPAVDTGQLQPRPGSQGAAMFRSTSAAQAHGSCCWVCENWRELRIVYTPGVSGPRADEIFLFTSLDGFQRPTKLQFHGGDFLAFLMAPAGMMHYIFQVGSDLLPSRTASVVEVAAPPQPALRIRREGSASAAGQRSGAAEVVGDPAAGSDDAAGAGRAGGVLGANVTEVRWVNTLEVSAREPGEPVCMALQPRTVGFRVEAATTPAWELETSLFAPYEEMLAKRTFCDASFDVDWRLARFNHMLRNDYDRAQVRESLRSQYAELTVLYRSLCSAEWELALQTPASRAQNASPLVFGVSLHEFTHLLVQHCLVGEELSLEDSDAQFIIAAAPGHLIARHRFLELLVRLAMRWAGRSGGKSRTNSVGKALEYILSKHIMYPYPSMRLKFKAVQWRADVLHSETVERVLRKHCQEMLDPMFNAVSKAGMQGIRYMDTEGWFDVLDALEVLEYRASGDQMALWDRVWLWQVSAISRIDEWRGDSLLQLSFAEFLEAIARLAALMRSREKVARLPPEERDKWDYGLDGPCASTVFCADKDGVLDRGAFAGHLSEFLCSARMRRALQRLRDAVGSNEG